MSGHRTETDGGSRSQAVRPASTAPTVFGAQITPRALAWARQSVDATEQPEQMKPGTSEQSFRIPTDGGPVRSSDRLPRRHRTRHQRKTSGPSPHHESPYTETELNEQPGAPLHTQQPTQRAATHSTPKGTPAPPEPLHTQQSNPHTQRSNSTPGIRTAPQPPTHTRRSAPAPHHRLKSRTGSQRSAPVIRSAPTGPLHTHRSAPHPPVRHHTRWSGTTPGGPAPHPVVRHRAQRSSPHTWRSVPHPAAHTHMAIHSISRGPPAPQPPRTFGRPGPAGSSLTTSPTTTYHWHRATDALCPATSYPPTMLSAHGRRGPRLGRARSRIAIGIELGDRLLAVGRSHRSRSAIWPAADSRTMQGILFCQGAGLPLPVEYRGGGPPQESGACGPGEVLNVRTGGAHYESISAADSHCSRADSMWMRSVWTAAAQRPMRRLIVSEYLVRQ